MTRKRRTMTWVLVVGGVVAAVVLVWFARAFISVAKASLEAEDRLQATILTCEVVGDHLEANGFTEWPRSWDRLAAAPPQEWSRFRWPDDILEIRQLVVVDFEADLDAVAAATPETFLAVRPNGVCYEVWRGYAAEPLLRRIRDGRRQAPSSPTSTPRPGPPE
jgi:hypothetical protein